MIAQVIYDEEAFKCIAEAVLEAKRLQLVIKCLSYHAPLPTLDKFTTLP